MFRLSLVTKRQELNARYAAISPEKWKREKDVVVGFKSDRLPLGELREVTEAESMGWFDPRVPTFVEAECDRLPREILLSALLPSGSTSNNEMEYLAMLKAMELVPRQMYVVIETDSQMCIDSLTKFRKRWEKNGGRLDNGTEVASAAIIGPLARAIDQRWACFRKIRGHSNNEWNDRANALAVQWRDLQAKKVVVKIAFQAVLSTHKKFSRLDRFTVSSLANLKYM
jgi:ribonuclease HI